MVTNDVSSAAKAAEESVDTPRGMFKLPMLRVYAAEATGLHFCHIDAQL